MTGRTRLLAGVGGVLLFGLVLLYLLIFHAPVYLLMPHAPRDTSALFGSDAPLVIAHRGWSGVAPENTVAAFRKAAEAGYGIELDVTLSKDGEVVVIHDDELERTTSGEGLVSELPWSALRQLDAGSWFDPAFAGEPLPRLEDALAVMPSDLLVLVEMKTADDKRALPEAVARVLKASGREKAMVISFDPFLLETLREVAPELYRGQLVGSYEDSDLKWFEKRALQNLAFTDRVQQDAVLWEHAVLDRGLVQGLKANGYPVLTWTVNEPADIDRMKGLLVDGILTDHPDRVGPGAR